MSASEHQQPPSRVRVVLTIGLALFETLLFSGVSYGVGSLVPMLENRGVYGHLCDDGGGNSSTSTTVQVCTTFDVLQKQIALAFTITQVMTPFGNLVSGLILDRLGFRAVKSVAACLFGLGSLCFTLAQPGVDWLIFPGTILLGISGIQVIISNLQLSPMVKYPFLIASLLSGLFDACTMVTSTLVIISNNGVNSFAAFGVYTALGVITIVLTIAIYPGKHSLLKIELETPSNVSAQQLEPHEEPAATATNDINVEMESRGTLVQQLISTDFIIMIVWFTCNNLRLNYFFASLNAYVDVITNDKDQVEHYATIFGYFFLTSPLISLVPGFLLDFQKLFIPALRHNTYRAYKLNIVTTLTTSSLLGIASCLIMLPNTTAILIPTYIVISIYRSFLFSTLGNYCISVFSPQYFGVVYTTTICTAAPFMFLSEPLTNWLKNTGNPNTINYMLAGLACVSLVHPTILLLRNLRGSEKKQVEPMTIQYE